MSLGVSGNPDCNVFYDDVANAYGDELRSLAAAGCGS